MGNKDLAKANNYSNYQRSQSLTLSKKTLVAICEIVVEMYARGFEFLGIDLYKSDNLDLLLKMVSKSTTYGNSLTWSKCCR